jgi:aryl-alcohol dehydrogenase-like predicted oxidoreductase
MAKHFGMTVTPWAPLGGGVLSGKYLRGEQGRVKAESNRRNDRSIAITETVVEIANELRVPASHIALQWTMSQGFSSIPIAGATKVSQLEENMKAVDVKLSAEQLQKLDEVSKIDLGFPGEFFREAAVKENVYGGFYDKVEKRK